MNRKLETDRLSLTPFVGSVSIEAAVPKSAANIVFGRILMHCKQKLPVAIFLALTSGGLMAMDGTGVQAGPFRVKPTIGLTIGHDSNVAQTADREISSFFTRLSPGIRLDSGNEQRSFSLSYEIERADYKDSDVDNYTDHLLNAGAKFSPTVRTRFGVGASLERGHDRRGENSRQGSVTALDANGRPLLSINSGVDIDQWRRSGVDGNFAYGAPGARGLLELGAGISNLEYRNNRDYARFGDRDSDYLRGRFGWRIASKTALFVEAQNGNVDYDENRRRLNGSNFSLDSNTRLYRVGVKIDPTAKLSGSAAVGRERREFDDDLTPSYSGTNWNVGVQFRPRSYSVFDLSSSRASAESVNFLGGFDATDYLISRDVTLAWTHGWSDRFQTGVDLGQARESYRSGAATTREDDVDFWGLSADYKMREWFTIGAGYKSYQRDADVSGNSALNDRLFDYDRDEISLTLEATL
jgi:polysaccharide biosynthesis protein VpsM